MGRTDPDNDLGDLRRGAAVTFFATMLAYLIVAGAGLMAGEIIVLGIALLMTAVSMVAIIVTFRKPATARTMSRILLLAMVGLWVTMLALDGGPGDDLTGWLMILAVLVFFPIIALRTTGAIVRREQQGAPPWRMRPPRVLDIVVALGLAAGLIQLGEHLAVAAALLATAVAIPAAPRFGWWLAGTSVAIGAGTLATSVWLRSGATNLSILTFALTLLMLPTMWLGLRGWDTRRDMVRSEDPDDIARMGDIAPGGASDLSRDPVAAVPASWPEAARHWFAPRQCAHLDDGSGTREPE